MKGLNAVRCNKCNKTIFSWSVHQLSSCTCGSVLVDGGFDYLKRIGSNYTELNQEDIPIEVIREDFTWGQNYTKEGIKLSEIITRLLKDLTTDHIIGILLYFTNKLEDNSIINSQWKIFHLIFLQELQYRQNNKIYE